MGTDRTTAPRRVAIVGTGVIGAGWAARCLARGCEVVASDPGRHAEARLRAAVDNAWPALRRLSLAPGADPAALTFTAELEAAVAEADFVQESAPENEDLKRKLLARIDAAAPPGTVIASSSSGLLPSRIQADCAHPGRVVIGHPFNPVYLLPRSRSWAATRPRPTPGRSRPPRSRARDSAPPSRHRSRRCRRSRCDAAFSPCQSP